MDGKLLPMRRGVLPKAVRACVIAITVARPTSAGPTETEASATAGADVATRLAPNVDLIRGRFVPNVQPDGNTVVLHAPRGLIVVDTGRHPDHTEAILELARQARAPVSAVINTHWHLDHVGGNPVVRQRYPDARVYASGALDGALKGFLADYRAQLQAMIDRTADVAAQKPWRAELAIVDSGAALAPDERIDATADRTIAGRRLRVGLETHAVTAGDVWVLDRATRVLAAGDLVTLPVPLLDTACPAGWDRALGALDRIDFAVLVPGHGSPMKRKSFETYRAAFARLLSNVASDRTPDDCIAGWTKDAAPLLTSEDPAFVRALLGYYVDLLRGDASRLAQLCAS
jgi:glyoxylase-like metal-dependent hydrolase (beta-lactamase superfamily II)